MDELHAPGHGGREADAVVGAVHVVVHGLGDGDDRDPFVVHSQPVGQGVVAADRDEDVDVLALQYLQHMIGDVMTALRPDTSPLRNSGRESALILAGLVREVWRKVPPVRSTVRTVLGSRGKRLPATVESSAGFTRDEPAPSPADSHDLMALVGHAVHDRLDAGVETGDITSSSQNADPHMNLRFDFRTWALCRL